MSDKQKNQIQNDSASTKALVKRIVHTYLKPYFKMLGFAVFFMVIAATMTAIFAKLVQPVLDDVLIKGDENKIVPIALAVFACFVLRGVSTYAHTVMMNIIGQSIVSDIQKDLLKHSLALDLSYFQSETSGAMVAKMISDVNVMRAAVADSLTGIGKSALTLVLLIAVMFYQDWKLAIAAFTIFPFAAFFIAWLGRRLRKISGKTQESIGDMASLLAQVFQGVRQVKAYGQEGQEIKRTGRVIDRVRDLNIKNTKTGNLSTPVNDILVGSAVLGLIIYGGYQAMAGGLSPGSLMSFITAFLMSYEPMKKLAKLNNNLQTGLGAAERVFAVIDTRAEIVDEEGAVSFSSKQVSLAFDNVSFSYRSDDDVPVKVLNEVSFAVQAGQTTAIIGPSGAGKSTLFNLALRFYDPDHGALTLNDTNIKQLTLESLRAHMALVSQDIVIFDDTVAANIAYGLDGASQQEVENAAKAANAHDFISELEEGYGTRLGENGQSLSGGQRQRIAIARAILRDAPILLLDEATSALDNESEALIQDSLEKIAKGKTVLVIAHRLSTIQNADHILVMDQGEIVEEGTHTDLMRKKGLYAALHKKSET